jgi:hypothetical protein
LNNRKSHNSILFLTTLGVYLGLVLVGSTPVLGHAAMTRNFDIQDEIEVKDDLDNKPDGENTLLQFASSFEELYRITAEASADHPDKVFDGQYSFNYFVSVRPKGGSRYVSPSPFNNGPRIDLGRNSKPIRQLYDAFLPRAEEWHEKLFVQFGLGLDEISFRITLAQPDSEAAASLSSAYSKALSRLLAVETNLVRILIFQSMEVSVEKENVIVSTRLPRAGLDTLLAKDAK